MSSRWVERAQGFFDWDSSGAAKLGDVAVLSAVLFLGAWTPARLRAALARAVAAPVRARSTGFKPKDRVHTSNSGAQWTARPTDSLRLWADWRAAILAAVSSRWVERAQGFFDREGRARRSRARKSAENLIQT